MGFVRGTVIAAFLLCFGHHAMADPRDGACKVSSWQEARDLREEYERAVTQLEKDTWGRTIAVSGVLSWIRFECASDLKDNLNSALGDLREILKKNANQSGALPVEDCLATVRYLDRVKEWFLAYRSQVDRTSVATDPSFNRFVGICLEKKHEVPYRYPFECKTCDHQTRVLDQSQTSVVEEGLAAGTKLQGDLPSPGPSVSPSARAAKPGPLRNQPEGDAKAVVSRLVRGKLNSIAAGGDTSLTSAQRAAAKRKSGDESYIQGLTDHYYAQALKSGWGERNLAGVLDQQLNSAFGRLGIAADPSVSIPVGAAQSDGYEVRAALVRSAESLREEAAKEIARAEKEVALGKATLGRGSVERAHEQAVRAGLERVETGDPVPVTYGESEFAYVRARWEKAITQGQCPKKCATLDARAHSLRATLDDLGFKVNSRQGFIGALRGRGGGTWEQARLVIGTLEKMGEKASYAIEVSTAGSEVEYRVVQRDPKRPESVVDVLTGQIRPLQGDLYHSAILEEHPENLASHGKLKLAEAPVALVNQRQGRLAGELMEAERLKLRRTQALHDADKSKEEREEEARQNQVRAALMAVNLPEPKGALPPVRPKTAEEILKELGPSDVFLLLGILPKGGSLSDGLKLLAQMPPGMSVRDGLDALKKNQGAVQGALAGYAGGLPKELPAEVLAVAGWGKSGAPVANGSAGLSGAGSISSSQNDPRERAERAARAKKIPKAERLRLSVESFLKGHPGIQATDLVPEKCSNETKLSAVSSMGALPSSIQKWRIGGKVGYIRRSGLETELVR